MGVILAVKIRKPGTEEKLQGTSWTLPAHSFFIQDYCSEVQQQTMLPLCRLQVGTNCRKVDVLKGAKRL